MICKEKAIASFQEEYNICLSDHISLSTHSWELKQESQLDDDFELYFQCNKCKISSFCRVQHFKASKESKVIIICDYYFNKINLSSYRFDSLWSGKDLIVKPKVYTCNEYTMKMALE